MNAVTVFNPGQVPDFVRNRTGLSTIAQALAGADSAPRISIKGGVFRLVKGGKEITSIEERYLDVVIVNAAPKVNRVWYAQKYDSDNTAAPDCWSADGKTPSADSAKKQHDNCDACPQNIAGSGEGDSRACRFQQQLAVVLANDMEGDVLNLSVPAKSLFGKEEGDNRPLQAFVRWLVAQNVDPSEVITRMRFDTKAESPKLFWKAMRWLTPEEFATATTQGKTPEAVKAVTVSFGKSAGGEVSAPIKETLGEKPVRPAEKKETKPAAEEEPPAPAPKPSRKKTEAAKPEPEQHPEPTVRKEEVKPSVVPTKGALAAMVDDWAED